MNKTAISWTKVTWNPVHGCSKVSEGCRNCYAETLSLKYGWTRHPWTNPNVAENVSLKPHKLNEPLKLKEPSRIFVNSMSDLFHEAVPDSYIRQIFDVMNACPQHTFQILTKRSARASSWEYGWASHIWMGVSVESPRAAFRLDDLRACPALVKFVSAEPLIADLGPVNLSGMNWVIVGGESGPNRRPMPHAWARNLRDRCVNGGIAYFFKQSSAPRTELGTSLHHGDGSFWTWSQWPDDLSAAAPAAPHSYACEPIQEPAAW